MSVKAKIEKVMDFLMHDIYRVTEADFKKPMRILVRFLKKIVLSIRGFIEDDISIKASALTYYTVFALVPIMALILAIGKGFGFQESIEAFVVKLLGENQEFVPIVMDFVHNYLNNIRGGVFVGVGIAMLLWAVLNMFRQIEANFNRIWNVKKNRSIVRQFTTYITVFIVVPILIVVTSGLNSKIEEWVSIIEASTAGVILIPIYRTLINLAPFVVYWLLFTLVFVLIPNTKVRFSDALLSGIITGTAMLVVQSLYFNGQISLSKYNAVYGSFAAVPLLLFLFQLSWMIVLYGAELCYVSQNLENFSFDHDTKNITRRYSDYITIVVLKVIVDRFCNGEEPYSALDIAQKYNIPNRLVNDHLKLLVETKIVSEIYIDGNIDRYYQPALDVNKITLNLVYDRVMQLGSENFRISEEESFKNIWNCMQQIQNDVKSRSADVLLRNL